MVDYRKNDGDFRELSRAEYEEILKPMTFREGMAVADLVDELWEAGEHYSLPRW